MLRFQRRRELSAEETAFNAARRAARAQAAMTCQCCNRPILANKGQIALHGYQRPGHGWQTASCMGARALPFEVDRGALAKMIEGLKNYRDTCQKHRDGVAAERIAIVREFTDYSKPRVWNGIAKRERHPTFTVEFTRENFDEQRKNPQVSRAFYHYRFDELLKAELASRDSEIKAVDQDITAQQARYDGWKQTHRREGDQWVAV